MRNMPHLLFVLLSVALACICGTLRSQDPVCEKCNGTGHLEAEPCPTHKALRIPMSELGMQLHWGTNETCCNLTGKKPCLSCSTKKRTYENEEDTRLDHHLYYAWRSGNAVSVDSISNVLRKMGSGFQVACTDRFLLVANPPVGQFTKAEYAALEPELTEAGKRFPGLIKLQPNTVTPEDMTILYLLRCEDLYSRFWKLLGREDAPDFMLFYKGRESEGLYVAPTRRRLEVFVLHTGDALRAFEVQHYGNSRMVGIPERFTVVRPDESAAFEGEALPGDRYSQSMLAYRIGAGLTTRLLTFQSDTPNRSATVPFFLEIGLAHALSIDSTGKSIYKAGTSEVRSTGRDNDDDDEWKTEEWLQQMQKLVGARKDGASNAPTFDQLTAVKLETAKFQHHLAAWSLVTFLRLLPDDGQQKFFKFILELRAGADAGAALNTVYGVTGRELTEAWHGWARDSSRQLLAPTSPLKGAGPQSVLANYKKVMAEKTGKNKNAADLAQRRRGAIASLRFAPPAEATTELIDHLSVKAKPGDARTQSAEDEAVMALQTLRMPELSRPEVATILNDRLLKSINKLGDEEFQIRLLRAAGSQLGQRDTLLNVLHRYLQSPAPVASAAAYTLGELRHPNSLPVLREVAANQSAMLRAEAAKAIAEIGPDNDLELATKLLADNSWHVRIAAIEMFKKLRTPEAGDKLIARMPLENGRLLEDIETALIEMTRPQLLPNSAEAWREFWFNQGGRDSISSSKAPSRSAGRTQVTGDFAGFPPIKSKRFMFMVDVSESMNQPVNLIPKGGTVSASGNSRPKIRFITQKLMELISDPKQIPEDVLFDIAFFASRTDTWKGQLVPTEGADSANRNSAAQFLMNESRAQVASTDLKRALESALKLAKESLNKADRESAIDTIYLLTDGSPTAGKIQDPNLLCDWFREENRNHRIKIFVICIGATDTDTTFLERLSRENYGPKPVVVMKDG